MGIFNYIDTFFFISLGITFILILLLVFHFKQRISNLENKNDTMFEIINNIVKEILLIKHSVQQPSEPFFLPENPMVFNEVIKFDHNKIVVSDDESEDHESEEDHSEDDESEEYDSHDDELDNLEDELDEKSIKVINYDINESINIDNIIDEAIENNDTETFELKSQEQIVIEKIDNLIINEEDNSIKPSQKETNFEMYRSMTLAQLKTLLISKGIATDTSRMKRPQVLKLLENNIDE
jgi:hypothetical protein